MLSARGRFKALFVSLSSWVTCAGAGTAPEECFRLHATAQHAEARACYARLRATETMPWAYYQGDLELSAQADPSPYWKQALAYPPAKLRLAEWYLSQGRADDARPLIRELLVSQPDSARVLYLAGKLDGSADLLRRAVAREARFGQAHYELALVLRRAGRREEAAEHFRQFQEHGKTLVTLPDPLLERLRAQAQSGTDLLQKGRRLEEAGDWAAAAEAYRQAAAADARLVQAQMNLIGVYGRLGAIAQAEESHRISGGGAEADYNLGVVRLGAQQFREAEALFRAAVQANPHFADAWNNLGLVRQAQGATEEARSSFQRALDSAPRHAEANVNLARLLSRAGADGAEKHFQLAIDSAPGRSLAAYRFYFAEYLQRAQRSADAMLQLQEARRNAEQNAQNEMAAYLDRVLREWSQRAP